MTTHTTIDHAGPDAIGTVTECADEQLADTQRAIIEAAERRGYERGLKDAQHAPAPYARVLAQAEADSDALRADAERYRWLRARYGRISETYDGDSGRIIEIDIDPDGWDVDADTLDSAIDAAMEAKR